MRRWVFNIAAAASLLLSLATVGIWIHSRAYFTRSECYFLRQFVWIEMAKGEAIIDLMDQIPQLEPRWFSWVYTSRQSISSLHRVNGAVLPGTTRPVQQNDLFSLQMVQTDHLLLGFGFGNSYARQSAARELQRQSVRHKIKGQSGGLHFVFAAHRLVLPLWFIVLATATLPAWWLQSSPRQHKRKSLGLCAVCGYDLRATPDRCPECGTIPTGKETASI